MPDKGEKAQAANLRDLLQEMIDKRASDLHITAGVPPMLRIDGIIRRTNHAVITPEVSKQIAYSIITEEQQKRFENEKELDFSFGVQGLSRFRANVFQQRGVTSIAIRQIPFEILDFKSLGLPPVVEDLSKKHEGARPRHGPDGKRQVDDAREHHRQDQQRAPGARHHDRGSDRVHPPAQEVHREPARGQGRHGIVRRARSSTSCGRIPTSFSSARCATSRRCRPRSRSPRRGTWRSRRSTRTRPSSRSTASSTRFPPNQQSQVRAQLAFVLEGVITQQLIPHISGKGRVLVAEVMVCTPAIRACIRDDKIHQIYGLMQAGTKYGMQTMNQALFRAYTNRQIIARGSDDVQLRHDRARTDARRAREQHARRARHEIAARGTAMSVRRICGKGERRPARCSRASSLTENKQELINHLRKRKIIITTIREKPKEIKHQASVSRTASRRATSASSRGSSRR